MAPAHAQTRYWLPDARAELLLASSNVADRVRGVRLLSRRGARSRAIAELRALPSHEASALVRIAALQELSVLGATDAIDVFDVSRHSRDETEQRVAHLGLVALGSEDGFALVVSSLRASFTQSAAIDALTRSPVAFTPKLLRAVVDEPSEDARVAFIRVFAELRDPRALPRLEALAQEGPAAVSAIALSASERIVSGHVGRVTPNADERLLVLRDAAATEPSMALVVDALEHRDVTMRACESLLEVDARIRLHASLALLISGSNACQQTVLSRALDHERDPAVLRVLLTILETQQAWLSYDAVASRLGDASTWPQWMAIGAGLSSRWGDRDRERWQGDVRDALDAPDALVRAAAVHALAESSEPRARSLLARLDDASPCVRFAAARALAGMALDEAGRAFLRAHARVEPSREVAQAFLDAAESMPDASRSPERTQTWQTYQSAGEWETGTECLNGRAIRLLEQPAIYLVPSDLSSAVPLAPHERP